MVWSTRISLSGWASRVHHPRASAALRPEAATHHYLRFAGSAGDACGKHRQGGMSCVESSARELMMSGEGQILVCSVPVRAYEANALRRHYEREQTTPNKAKFRSQAGVSGFKWAESSVEADSSRFHTSNLTLAPTRAGVPNRAKCRRNGVPGERWGGNGRYCERVLASGRQKEYKNRFYVLCGESLWAVRRWLPFSLKLKV